MEDNNLRRIAGSFRPRCALAGEPTGDRTGNKTDHGGDDEIETHTYPPRPNMSRHAFVHDRHSSAQRRIIKSFWNRSQESAQSPQASTQAAPINRLNGPVPAARLDAARHAAAQT